MNQPQLLAALMILSALNVGQMAERAQAPKEKVRLFLEGREPMPKAMFERCCAVARAEITWRRETAEALLHGPLFASSLMGCALSEAWR